MSGYTTPSYLLILLQPRLQIIAILRVPCFRTQPHRLTVEIAQLKAVAAMQTLQAVGPLQAVFAVIVHSLDAGDAGSVQAPQSGLQP